MAPFSDDNAIAQQHQSGVRANNCFQRGFVGGAEGIFGSREFHPAGNGLFGAGGEAIKRDVVLLRVFVKLVDFAKIRVIGLFQMRRNEQKGVVRVVEHLLCDVVANVGCWVLGVG